MALKHYLITGAGRGIGRGLSRHLLQKGNRVVLLDNNVSELKNTASLLSKNGHAQGKDFETIECNLRQPNEITSAAKKAGEVLNGRLDCLINNAACGHSCNHIGMKNLTTDNVPQTQQASAAHTSPTSLWMTGTPPSKPTLRRLC